MDETPIGEMNYLILSLGRRLKGLFTNKELQEMPLPGLYEISHNLYKIMTEENKDG